MVSVCHAFTSLWRFAFASSMRRSVTASARSNSTTSCPPERQLARSGGRLDGQSHQALSGAAHLNGRASVVVTARLTEAPSF